MKLKLGQLLVLFIVGILVLFFVFVLLAEPAIFGMAGNVSATVVSTETLNWQQLLSLTGANDFEGSVLALVFKGLDNETSNATFILYGCKTSIEEKCIQVNEDKVIKIINVPEKASISQSLTSFAGIPYVKEELFLEKINYSSNPNSLTVEIKIMKSA